MSTKPAGFRQDSEALSPEAAEALTAEIVGVLTGAYDEVVPLVIRAFRGRAWVGCGFTSWDAYCKARFTGARMLRIPRATFTEIALIYADAGMSVRAIGSATGTSKDTAARALNKSNRKPGDVIGLDDRRQKRNREIRAKVAEETRALYAAMDAHPAGKGEGMPAWRVVVAAIEDLETATYVELCDELGWRDGKVTGAISEASRRGAIRPTGERSGNTAWTVAK
jgi:hypothetical protein